jgi:cytochrome oxidase Cu insertion factor (SCO1/SenC/PrrC family)
VLPRRLAALLVAFGLLGVAGGTAALVIRHASSTSGTANIALEATTPAGQPAALDIADVRLLGGATTVPLLQSSRHTSLAPALTNLGIYAVQPGTYTGVSATVGGKQYTVAITATARSGGVVPIVLVLRPDGVTAAAGNDGVNDAVLTAAGQLLRAPDVTFTDQNGQPVPFHSLQGRVLVVAALDTHCHDTCPLYTALWADLRDVIRERGWGDRVAIAEVSMDPERDTPAELAAYAQLTGATWPLLRADVAQTFQFWTALHAGYTRGRAPSPAPTDWYTQQPETYHLDHDSLAVVFDGNGNGRYLLQGNPTLAHALPQALANLIGSPSKAQSLQNTASWSITDLLDRIDRVLGLPPESVRAGTEQAAREGSRPPDFTLPGLDGARTTLSAQKGRPSVVTFWATWCAPCRNDLPRLAAAQKAHPGLVVLAVDEGEGAGQVRDYLHSLLGADASRMVALLDGDHAIGGKYLVSGLPVTVFVGADGIVQRLRIGELHDDDMTTALAAIGL